MTDPATWPPSRMKALDLLFFHWMAAGFEPRPWLVAVAGAIAVGGPWLCAPCWAGWPGASPRSAAT